MKTFKTIITTSIFILTGLFSFAQQNTKLHIDSFYLDKNESLIYSEIYEFDSLSREELNTKIKNWAGLKFVNMKEVLVSETKEQMVFNYITSDFYIKGLVVVPMEWYIRLSIQIKDNKIKVSLFDDGNAPHSAAPARSSKLSSYFSKDGTLRPIYTAGMLNLKKSCIDLSKDINNVIKSSTSNTKKDDW